MGTVTHNYTLGVIPSGYSTSNSSYSSISTSYPVTNGYTNSSSTNYAYITCNTGSRASSYISYTFDVSSIPADATITSVSCAAKSRVSSTSYISTAVFQLYTNTTAKGSSVDYRSTTASARTLTNTGTWTRNELNNIQLRHTATRGTSNTNRAAYIYFYGADLTINYSVSETAYSITVTNNSTATVTPMTQDVVAGDSGSIMIDDISGITVTDNNTDVTSQFVYSSDAPPGCYTVSQASGASYGFTLNSNDYYESTNKGVSSSTALCVVHFTLPVQSTITFSLINYAEATYDFGILGNLDGTLSTSQSEDSSYKWSGKNNNSASVQTVTYSNVSAGSHDIYVKYFKDQYTDSNNDSLQFKVSVTLSAPQYRYTISNVSADHTIVVNPASTEQLYLKVGGVWTAVSEVYKKINGSWVKQSNLSDVFDTSTTYVHKS